MVEGDEGLGRPVDGEEGLGDQWELGFWVYREVDERERENMYRFFSFHFFFFLLGGVVN